MKFLLPFLLLISFNLFGFGFSGGSGGGISSTILNNFFGSMNSIFEDSPPVDSWETSINDTSPPEENDRNITTKTINKPFVLSLGSIKLSGDDYEKKEKGSGSNHNIEITLYTNNTPISNTIFWDPTEDKHIDSSELTPTQSTQDAQIRFYMCASIDTPTMMDFIGGFFSGSMNIGNMLNSFFSTHTLKIHALDQCSGAVQDCDFSTDKHYVECLSTNHFAIKPEKLSFTLPTHIKSAQSQSLEINATKYNSTSHASRYTFTTSDYTLEKTITKYLPDNTVSTSLKGEIDFVDGNFTDGDSNGFSFDFNDTAKINLQLIDKDWASVDDDTEESCDGRWICGDANTTVIPHHFKLSEVKVVNEDDEDFTYYSNSKEMQAHIELTIEAQNEKDTTTQNFDKDSWENPLSVTFTLPSSTKEENKTEISNENLSFEDGIQTLHYEDNNLTFNYKRENNSTQNPFLVLGSDVNITVSSLYGDKNITGISTADKNVTFLYARVHTPRTRIASDEGNASIYYEIYCSGSECDKTLLPDASASTYSDDPRWFTNSKHPQNFGNAGVTSQKRGSHVEISRSSNGVVQDYITLKYNATSFPYKTTMQNEATPWLIYNKYNPNTDKVEFEVEFEGASSDWIGTVEENVTATDKTDIKRANRRLSW